MSAVCAVPSFESFSPADSTRVAFRGSGTELDLEIILHSGGSLFREISEGRLMDLFCGRQCGFIVWEGRWKTGAVQQNNDLHI